MNTKNDDEMLPSTMKTTQNNNAASRKHPTAMSLQQQQ
jgi:hypothetical protein